MPTNSPTPDLPALLARGPSQPLARQAVANYLLTHQERIRAIARRKLTSTTRRVFDSEEVLSSVMRRLDDMAARGTLLPHSEAELWALVEAITKNTAVSKTRLIERTRNLLTEDGLYAYELLRRLNACETDDEATLLVQRMLLSLKEGADRRLVVLRLQGANHRAAADLLRTTEAATRQRWTKVRKELLERFLSQGPMDHSDEHEALASTMVDHSMAASLVPWPCPCEFGPDGRYRLEELVAAGPHSLVYRATDQSMSGEGFDAAVAIKVSRLPGAGRPEALTVRRVTHPNVLAVSDRGTTPEGLSYLVAEYVDGGDLSQVPLPMPPRDAAALIVRIASAVQAVHSAGIVHCDLKPANIMLTRAGEPKLGDFGLSHWNSDAGHGTRGNIAFMSPEQFFGTDDALTPPSDIYALGGLLYYLLLGLLPIGQTREEVEAAHRARRPAPSPGIDRDLDGICTRAMSRDRSSRHHSAGELADDLERWLRHEPIPWMRPSPARRFVLLLRRNPVRAVATAAALMLLAAAVGTLVYNRAEDRRRRMHAQDLAVQLANQNVEATRARVRAHIANAIGMLKSRAHGDLQEEYLPALVWLDWLSNSPLIMATGQVPAVQERLDLLSTLIDSNTKAGRPNHMDTMMAKFALARLALSDGQYLRPQEVLDDLNNSLVPLLSQDDPVRLSIAAMGACANANRALADGAGLMEAIEQLKEHDTILSRCGHAESTRRMVITILDRCALADRQPTVQ